MKYGEINLGQVEAIINKLGGEQDALRFLRGELVVSTAKPIEMPVWKTVKLGTCKTPRAYRKALKKAGRCIGDTLSAGLPARRKKSISTSSYSRLLTSASRAVPAMRTSARKRLSWASSFAPPKSAPRCACSTATSRAANGSVSQWKPSLTAAAAASSSASFALLMTCVSTTSTAILTTSGMLATASSSVVASSTLGSVLLVF